MTKQDRNWILFWAYVFGTTSGVTRNIVIT